MYKLNEQIEVSKKQFNALIPKYDGYIMHRQKNGMFYIKIIVSGETKNIINDIEKNK